MNDFERGFAAANIVRLCNDRLRSLGRAECMLVDTMDSSGFLVEVYDADPNTGGTRKTPIQVRWETLENHFNCEIVDEIFEKWLTIAQ